MHENSPSLSDWAALILLALVWGASFWFIKHSVEVFTPYQMAMWRMVLATVFYLPVALAFWSRIDWAKWPYLLVVAFFGSAIPNFLFAVAQQHVSSSLAGVLNSLTPLFTLLIGVSFFQMRFSLRKLAGVGIGFGGAALLIAFNQSAGMSGNWVFALLCALAALCYAVNANIVGRFLMGQHPGAIAAASFMLTCWLFFAGLWHSGGAQAFAQSASTLLPALGYIAYLAAIGTVGGSILYFWLLQRTGPVFATSVTYLLPVSALLIGLLDGESVGLSDLLGTGVILAGVYVIRKS